MATNKNINECGWFYHAPEKRSSQKDEPVPTPYISQIPGLSEGVDEEPTGPQGLYFKDTDSKFIRLSKQGGRKDLLVFKDNKEPQKEAQGYPRVDWFYLADNAREDAANQEPKKKHEFLLPEYMVHDSYVPSCIEGSESPDGGTGQRSRVPYACDKQNVFQTEGRSISDKRVKIPEARHPGYGVRNSKPVKPVKVPAQAGKPSALTHTTDTMKELSITHGDKTAQMHHILAYDYERQWHEQMHRALDKQTTTKPKGEPPIPSEYDDKFGKTVSSKKTRPSQSPTNRRVHSGNLNNEATQNTNTELFKLSKFKNVPSKIDSHQPIISKQVTTVSN